MAARPRGEVANYGGDNVTERRSLFRPLAMTWAEAAHVAFRRSESWLRSNIDKLDGFPRPDSFGLFAAEAVEAWFRCRHGLVTDAANPKDTEAVLLEKINAKYRRPVSGPKAA